MLLTTDKIMIHLGAAGDSRNRLKKETSAVVSVSGQANQVGNFFNGLGICCGNQGGWLWSFLIILLDHNVHLFLSLSLF